MLIGKSFDVYLEMFLLAIYVNHFEHKIWPSSKINVSILSYENRKPFEKNFLVPMSTGYQLDQNFWVQMGTGYQSENFLGSSQIYM